MDNHGTDQPIEFTDHWPADLPKHGFEWVEGFEVQDNLRIHDVFLSPRPGPVGHIDFPVDLYADFANLTAAQDRILDFANKYGSLHALGDHFHQIGDEQPGQGDSLSGWRYQLKCFHETLDLWFRANMGDSKYVRHRCRPLYDWRPGDTWIFAMHPTGYREYHADPIELARRVVILTTNQRLSATLRPRPDCRLPGCTFQGHVPDFTSHTRATLRANKKGVNLVVTSTDLLTTVWLQFAAYIAGERKLKKCAAPDCPHPYMDVTDSPRPAAKRMHRRCEERLRKRRYRQRKQQESNK